LDAAVKVLLPLLLLVSSVSATATATPQTSKYSQKTLLKNWALSICLAQINQDERMSKDAASTAGAYLEFGRQDLSVYEEIRTVVAKYVSLQYGGSVPSQFNTMKCIDLFHSSELDRLTTKAVKKK
jgi:hypothetical protein